MAENVNETGDRKSLGHNIFRELLPIEQRSLLGTVLIVATLLILGWVAINEQNRMTEFTAQYEARAVQRGAVIWDSNCKLCHGETGEGLSGKAPALNTPELFDGTRLEELGYPGSLRSYLESTVAAGRPVRSSQWANPMPTWSQDFGGPMRPDEIRDVVSFVMNWGCYHEDGCTPEEEVSWLDAYYSGEPVPLPGAAPVIEPPPMPEDWDEFAAGLPAGDPAHGEDLFQPTALTCAACHTTDGTPLVGPSLLGVKDRLPADVAPQTIEGYLAQSIWDPQAYFVAGFEGIIMPDNFAVRMTDPEQDLADIIAYLLTLE